jgi:hypothetical protein
MNSKKSNLIVWLFFLVFLFSACTNSSENKNGQEPEYTIAAFYWPAYHYEPRAEFLFPEKQGEGEIIYNAIP